jgi:predicted alpha-1,2-mannosidase
MRSLGYGRPAAWMTVSASLLICAACSRPATPDLVADPAAFVNPLIGTAGGGNTFPGAVMPFGMLAWSPENTRGDHTRAAAPGGYAYDAPRIRGFSLTHLSGTGCRGASGDVPFYPHVGELRGSPSADTHDRVYAARFAHANETAEPGYYQVRLASGVNVELTATDRTGRGRFTFPGGQPAVMLIRVSDSEVGSSDAQIAVEREARTVTGWVTSGNFCGYLGTVNRRSYYTLYFVAVFDRPFATVGGWQNGDLVPQPSARGGTTYGDDGFPSAGLGSGAYVGFDTTVNPVVEVRVGISYVSLDNARANLTAENAEDASFETLRSGAREAWNARLRQIRLGGGTADERTTFYTALYHSLLHMNLFSDANGDYWGIDQQVHRIVEPQKAQYANFSGWDVYRSQVQLVALVDPGVASDMAQSLLNQAVQNGGVWDRWTHNSGATHVMEGDPSPPTVAGIQAFGGASFDVRGAYASLLRAATVPTGLDRSDDGCPVACAGQRPSLDEWLTIHWVPTVSHAWGGAGETLEDVTADFALAQLAARLGDEENHGRLLARARYWKNLVNDQGFVQNRNADGTWPPFDARSDDGFAEGSSAQYTWMIPFNARGLFAAIGGGDRAVSRLDEFFHNGDGTWALTRLGPLKAEMDNEPSVGAAWLYLFAGQAYKTQATVREALVRLWGNRPDGIPGNDDLGAMSSWYVWSALGLYPFYPGRAELVLGSPLFPRAEIRRANGPTIVVVADGAEARAPYVSALRVDGRSVSRPWLPESFVASGGRLEFAVSRAPDPSWGAGAADAPPSFDTGER